MALQCGGLAAGARSRGTVRSADAVFRAQDEAAVEELRGVVRPEPESAGNGGAFVVADEGEQDLRLAGSAMNRRAASTVWATQPVVPSSTMSRRVVSSRTSRWRLALSVEQSSLESAPKTHRPSIAAWA
ncbi:hypothetical protein ADL04_01110 [Streptomyces sp. NRRL B-3648]|nr:hypothetical protein ADL04_01110 [Streptomyces sp. NRRL B-3648]